VHRETQNFEPALVSGQEFEAGGGGGATRRDAGAVAEAEAFRNRCAAICSNARRTADRKVQRSHRGDVATHSLVRQLCVTRFLGLPDFPDFSG